MNAKLDPPSTEAAPGGDKPQTLVGHLTELRNRLLRALVIYVLVFIPLFPFADRIYSLVATPLLRHMPEGSSMIAIEVASPFLIPLKLVFLLAAFLTVPYWLYQVWSFVAPGLYKKERRFGRPLLISSILLFYAGVAFAWFIVFPLLFAFFAGVAPEGVSISTDISRYLSFIIALFFAFGLAFEVPIVILLLVASGFADTKTLSRKRPYFIVAAFVIGMLLTPPDVISQTLLALPMWLLFEIGLLLARRLPSKD